MHELEFQQPQRERASTVAPDTPMFRYVVWPDDIQGPASVGNKASALARLAKARFPVPDFFVVLPEACLDSLVDEDRAAFLSAPDAEARAQLLANCRPCRQVVDAVGGALARLCPNREIVAVRSSALGEDGARHSFAGQLESFLDVAPADVATRIAAVWRSGFADRVRRYRDGNGLDPLPSVPAVIVQRMISATISGIAFSLDPVSNSAGLALVAAAAGTGESLADGRVSGSTWRVDLAGRAMPVGDGADPGPRAAQPGEEPIRRAATLARRAAELFGSPQDVEWCEKDDQLHVLQSRPITVLDLKSSRSSATTWDNSNIVENYGGVTSPLTFSFVRHVYDAAYRALARELGVSAAKISSHEALFENMIGLFQGRIYYNLTSWYRLLGLIPGFDSNRRYLDRMLGVRPASLDKPVPPAGPSGVASRLTSGLRLASFAFRAIHHHFTLAARVRRFRRRFASILGAVSADLSGRDAVELAADYRRLVAALRPLAAVPPLNDFAVMFYGGLAQKLLVRWRCTSDSAAANALIVGGPSVTVAISRELQVLAGLARLDAKFVDKLCEATADQIAAEFGRWPEFRDRYERYVSLYGDRGAEELKLESRSPRDDPLPLLRAIGRAARARNAAFEIGRTDLYASREAAVLHIRGTLRAQPLKRACLGWVLRRARNCAAHREDLRFDRARLFARVRRIFVAIGQQLKKRSVLNEDSDIFLLEADEVLAFLEGRSTAPDLRAVVELRRGAWERYRGTPPLPDRFLTDGMPYACCPLPQPPDSKGGAPGGGYPAMKGIGCCPGRVRGRVRVVDDPRRAEIESDEIIVAERTDPGWILIFAAAKGLIVERGNILSHAAIAAREFALPTIVSAAGATTRLKYGDWIEMDGATGEITPLLSAEHGQS